MITKKEEGVPFKTVFDKIYDIKKVIEILSKITKVSKSALTKEERLLLTTKNIDNNIIIVGNLPLQGTKTFVRIAINLSLGESIILEPVTPTALQPNPIAIVKDCLPQEEHFLKELSKVKATLGKYPTSSNKVNKGKKIAIGGNITDTTQVRTR